jgi:hypothetical protein
MTTVLVLARFAVGGLRVEGILRWAVLAVLVSGLTAAAQDRPVHWLNAGAMPPGAIGSLRLERGGPLSGYFQPVRIRAPEGARIALATEGSFSPVATSEALIGMQVGLVYPLEISNIPNGDNVDIYPTIELIDRLYPPPGLALRFPVPIELTRDELDLATRGAFVTRVIYVEDPMQALPIARKANDELPWTEAPAGEDPLVTADKNGRPIAILRIGSRRPDAARPGFGGPAPPYVVLDPNSPCQRPGCPPAQTTPAAAPAAAGRQRIVR